MGRWRRFLRRGQHADIPPRGVTASGGHPDESPEIHETWLDACGHENMTDGQCPWISAVEGLDFTGGTQGQIGARR